MTVRLPYREPFDWERTLDFFRFRATPGVEAVAGDAYRRTIRVDDRHGILDVRPSGRPGFLALSASGIDTAALPAVVQRARKLFDVDAPVDDIGRTLAADPVLAARLAQLPGVRVPGAWDGFELPVRAILGQQVSVAAATTLAGRIAERYGEPLATPDESLGVLFPTPARLMRARFNNIGLTTGRIHTIRALARAVERRELDFDFAQDADAFRGRLTSIKGIGDWTAQYVAMRVLKHPDAFPAADLGLMKAIEPPRRVTAAELAARAEAWRPWRAYAALLLWQTAPGSGG